MTSRGFSFAALFVLVWMLFPAPVVAQGWEASPAQSDFFQAMLAEDTQTALQLLGTNTNLARRSTYSGKFPLHVAASKGLLPVVERLLELGAEVDAEGDTWDTGNKKLTALQVAVWYNRGSTNIVQRLLSAGADPNHLSPWDGSALHMAFEYRKEDMAALLLDHGANPFLVGGNPYRRMTPFEKAVANSSGKLIPRMLGVETAESKGAGTNNIAPARQRFLATNGTAMLTLAAQRGLLEAVEAFLKVGVRPSAATSDAYSTMQAFAKAARPPARTAGPESGRLVRIRELLAQYGSDYDVFAATAFGDVDHARRLVGTNPALARARDHLGDTPLLWAVRTDQLPLTAFWLEAGAMTAATNLAGQTALHVAAEQGFAAQVDKLLAAQSPTNVKETNGWTALDVAIRAKQPETIRRLLGTETMANARLRGVATSIHETAASGNVVALAALLRPEMREARNELGMTPLQVAARSGQLGAAALLVDKGANVNAQDPEGNTVLHLILLARSHRIAGRPSAQWIERKQQDASNREFLRVFTSEPGMLSAHQVAQSVAFFLACGADPSIKNQAGRTVLQIAMDEQTMLSDDDKEAFLPLLSKGGGSLEERDANGDTALHRSVRGYDGADAKALLAAGAGLNVTNRLGRTPLHVAVEKIWGWGESQPLSVLLAAKPDVNARDNQGMTPLHVVARSEGRSSYREEATEALLKAGANPNLRDNRGRTAVHEFLYGDWPWDGTAGAIARLVAAGADVSGADDQGQTPLHLLALLKQSPLFFMRGITWSFSGTNVNVNARDRDGNTPLHLAAKSGSSEVFNWLCSQGAQLDLTNAAGQTPRLLMMNSREPFPRFTIPEGEDIFAVARSGDTAALQRLLAAEPRLATATNRQGETALRIAARAGRTNAVAWLAEHGATWDAVSAALVGNVEALQQNLAGDSRVVSAKAYGRTLLHFAAESGVIPAADAVLAAGGEINATDSIGLTALGGARWKDQGAMVEFLRTRAAAENVFDAVLLDDVPLLATVLRRDKDALTRRNQRGLTAGHVAMVTGRHQALLLMLTNGLPLDATDGQGETLLHLAALCGRTNEASLLLHRGADAESVGNNGFTTMHRAAAAGGCEIVELLLARGANVDAASRTSSSRLMSGRRGMSPGSTPLHLAAFCGQTNMVALLLAHGAQVNATNADGMTPLDLITFSPRPGMPMPMPFLVSSVPAELWRYDLQAYGVLEPVLQHLRSSPVHRDVIVRLLEQAGGKRLVREVEPGFDRRF